jgi:hypothetical protein
MDDYLKALIAKHLPDVIAHHGPHAYRGYVLCYCTCEFYTYGPASVLNYVLRRGLWDVEVGEVPVHCFTDAPERSLAHA